MRLAVEAFAARAGLRTGTFALRGPVLSLYAVHFTGDPSTAATRARAVLDWVRLADGVYVPLSAETMSGRGRRPRQHLR